MLQQRQVESRVDLLVRSGGAGWLLAACAALALLLGAGMIAGRSAAWGGAAVQAEGAQSRLGGLFAALVVPRPVIAANGDARIDAGRTAYSGTAAGGTVAGGTAQAARGTGAALKLSPEQQKIARFVATKYRLALDDVEEFVSHAYRAARELRLDPYLVLAVMSVESGFDPGARSPAGAQGLMQVLTRVHVDKFAPFGGVSAAFDPLANIRVGSRILKEYLLREGSVEGALKSYVGAALHDHDSGYGYKVLSERERIAAAAAGRPIPARPLARQDERQRVAPSTDADGAEAGSVVAVSAGGAPGAAAGTLRAVDSSGAPRLGETAL